MRSERSPEPTWLRRDSSRSAFWRSCSSCNSRERRTFRALALFLCWDFSSWQVTTRPVGRCVTRMAESVVFTLWPPGPEERYTSMRSSSGLISTSTSSASGSTATVTAEVWMRPWASVTGTRCTRCVPDSYLSLLYTRSPEMEAMTSLYPPTPLSLVLRSSTFHLQSSA